MATTTRKGRIIQPGSGPLDEDGFAVVMEREIGRVSFGPDGEQHPVVAAFGIIATYEADNPEGGTFRFPTPNGSTATVAVSYEGGDS